MKVLNNIAVDNELARFLSKYTSLSSELIGLIAEGAVVKSYKKGTILLKEGDIPRECYLVFKGCIRSYLVKDGEERTIEFYTEDQPVSPLNIGKKTPSEYYLECIEDTVACMSTPEHESDMFQKFPQLESACRIVTEAMIADIQASFASYRVASAEDRYLKLLKDRPNLVQRVPQYQLASYLGIKPESLSRIRKRLGKK